MLKIFLRFLFGVFIYLVFFLCFVFKTFFPSLGLDYPRNNRKFFRDVIIVNRTENSLTSFILFLTIERGYILFSFLLQTTHSWKAPK